jgi:hypothetical protein
MVAFTARGVSATELPDLNTEAVILTEDADGDGLRLELQRGLKYTEQDRRLGLDTYCLVTHTGATVYGGVRSYTLEGSSLTMRLEPIAYDTLGVPEEFTILLETDPATLEKVRLAMVSILGTEARTATS